MRFRLGVIDRIINEFLANRAQVLNQLGPQLGDFIAQFRGQVSAALDVQVRTIKAHFYAEKPEFFQETVEALVAVNHRK